MGLSLVTGGAGFIGSNMVRFLLDKGARVRVLDNFETGKHENLSEIANEIDVVEGDIRDELSEIALSQTCVKDGAISVVVTAIYERTTGKYGDRGIRYVHIETGHAAQNLCLQATALGLGLVTVGAFHGEDMVELLDLPDNEEPLYIVPVGRK